MGPIRRTINLILALALAAAGIRKPLQERTLIGLPAPVANHSSMMHRNAVLERVRAHADQSSEATRVHHASRRRGGLAARGTRAGGACRLLLGGRAKSTELQVSHARTSLSCWFRTTTVVVVDIPSELMPCTAPKESQRPPANASPSIMRPDSPSNVK